MPTKTLAPLLLALPGAVAVAHDGHGLQGSHWHASDVLGFVVLGIALALAVWAARRK